MNDPLNDPARLRALAATGLVDTLPQASLDRFTRIAARAIGVPVALVSLVDDHRQFFSNQVGLAEPWATRRQTPHSHSFCKTVVATGTDLVVTDARTDARVAGNGAVKDLGVVAYAGAPIRTADGHVLGSFCVIDAKPREWTRGELSLLSELRDAVVEEIELRQRNHAYERSEQILAAESHGVHESIQATSLASQRVVHDIRTPLNVIVLGSRLLLQHEAARVFPALAQMLERIERNAKHAASLVGELSPTVGSLVASDAVEIATQVVADHTKPRTPIACDFAVPAARVALGDTAVRRCLENVLGNALRFATSRIRVSVRANAAYAVLAVDDDGPGLPTPEAYVTAWDRGVRHHAEGASGTGLGLSIVKQVVEEAGGTVESGPSPLGGARFAMCLPLERATPAV